jgi:hypothetical protein
VENLSGALWLIGVAVSVVGFVWVLGVAFTEGVGWGMACLIIPVTPVILLLARPGEAWKACMVYGVGLAMTTGAQMLGG